MHGVGEHHVPEALPHNFTGHVHVPDRLLLNPGAVLNQRHRRGADVLAGAQRLAGPVPTGTGEIEEIRPAVRPAGAENLDQATLLERDQSVVHEGKGQPDRRHELAAGSDALDVERLEEKIDDELLGKASVGDVLGDRRLVGVRMFQRAAIR